MMYVGILMKLIVGFFGTMLVIRLVGKKSLSELTPYDIIYSIILGGIIQEGLYDDQVDVGHILFAMVAWGTVIYTVETLLQRRDKLTRRMKGSPSVLIYRGELNIAEIRSNHIEMEQLRSMLRKEGIFSLKEVDYAVIETNGQISLRKKEDQGNPFTYLLVDDGEVEHKSLKSIGKDSEWLYDSLIEAGFSDIKQIVYAEWSYEDGFFIKTYADSFDQQIAIDG